MISVRSYIVVTSWAMNERDFERFGCEFFESKGYNVQVFDAMDICFPGLRGRVFGENSVLFEKAKVIANWLPLKALCLTLNSDDIFILIAPLDKKSLELLRFLSLSKAKFGTLAIGAVPQSSFLFPSDFSLNSIQTSVSILFKRIFKKLSSFVSKLKNTIWFLCKGLRFPNFFVSGSRANQSHSGYFHQFVSKTIKVHSTDFDTFLSIKAAFLPRVVEEKYAVFLDEFYPYHPDNLAMGIDLKIDADEYYRTLDCFFRHLETIHSVQIVVAAHPRSDYELRGDNFYGRKVIKGQTGLLVRDSEFVIAHQSTSTSFAACFQKRVFFVVSNQIDKTRDFLTIRLTAAWFGESVINVDKPFENSMTLRNVKPKLPELKRYIDTFLTYDSSETRRTWELFEQQIVDLEKT
jgi:hypothetical protein